MHPRSLRHALRNRDRTAEARALAGGDPRRWPYVALATAEDRRAVGPAHSIAATHAVMAQVLLSRAGIVDADLRAVIEPVYLEWLRTSAHVDAEIEAAVINTLDAAIDEQDRRRRVAAGAAP